MLTKEEKCFEIAFCKEHSALKAKIERNESDIKENRQGINAMKTYLMVTAITVVVQFAFFVIKEMITRGVF